MGSKKWIAMLLAGGQGTRLGELTKRIAKPAVPFGGKYRIIDFPLSNCAHSGLDTVGVLTQYQSHSLHDYVGSGETWNLDLNDGGISLLPPFEGPNGYEWYKGTAHAIYQNIDYIDQFNPENVLILSGDHIYKMDYSKMLDFHLIKQAQATIGVIQVPWQEAGRFGIMNINESYKVTEFNEKPSFPKSNLASMGIYLFNWKVLRKYLIEDEQDVSSSHDFGKNIIPKMLQNQRKLYAYPFKGYWKDVGTVNSLWDAHMDLLQGLPTFQLSDPEWKILSRSASFPPHYVSREGGITHSLVYEGCIINGTIERSVLSYNIHIGKNSTIKDSVIMPNVWIGDNVHIERAIIANDSVIEDGVFIGNTNPTSKIILIGENRIITAPNAKTVANH